jgi:hypothetical protein
VRVPVILALLVAGCGSNALPDPCANVTGDCISLTLTSDTVKQIDTVHIIASGAISGTRDSAKGQASSLPISLAIAASSSAIGPTHVIVEGVLSGEVLGVGETDFTIAAGERTSITVDLKGGVAPPDLGGTGDGGGCDTQSDVTNCGACGHDCTKLPHVTGTGVTCTSGACVVPAGACASGFAHCSTNADDGCETDLSQATHCGSCTTSCSGGTPLCAANGGSFSCVASCSAPTPDLCGGNQCVDLTMDANNCKTCGHACNFANAGATCAASTCTIGACNAGYKDCVGGPADGCETYVKGSDKMNCGDCNVVCAPAHATSACTTGVCSITACDPGYKDCVNGLLDGCETFTGGTDNNNCGGCGVKCLVGQFCMGGSCVENVVNCSTSGATCQAATCSSGTLSVSLTGDIVVDTANGRRLWSRPVQPKAIHDVANNFCNSLVLDGISGWRLPAVNELSQTLRGPGGLQGCGQCNPAIDQAAFPNVPMSDLEWTTSPGPGGVFKLVDYCGGRSTYYGDPSTGEMYTYRCTHDPGP